MVNIIIEVSKYLIIMLITMYTYSCFSVFVYSDPYKKRGVLFQQNVIMFMLHIICYLVMYLETEDKKLVVFYFMQVCLFIAVIFLYSSVYPKASRLVVNNMCMLLCIGMIMLTRLDYESAFKQFVIASAAMGLSFVVPVIVHKLKMLSQWRKFYAIAGILALGIVVIVGKVTYGAMLSFDIFGISIQPSELVKIIFVFFAASSFKFSLAFRNIVITTAVAAFHVLILVVSRDLGAALIIFVVYLAMLYVATRQPLYIAAGLVAGSGASVGAYYLFNHVRVRVKVWQDPFKVYDEGGYQVAQSLFAIGTGSWFGTGLFQGAPDTIPVATSDFIFSAISEEMGLIFTLCLILICLSCYIMFLNISMQLHTLFYKLVALGLGTGYIFQVFLTIGGAVKFIPSTGVTLPLVSYGGSSLFSTIIMFAIIQGLYIIREDEEEDIEKRKLERLRAERSAEKAEKGLGKKGHDSQRKKRIHQGGQDFKKKKEIQK